MLLPGRSILRHNILRNLISATHQQQPCGVDLSLRRVLQWTSPATINFDNSHRRSAATSEVLFSSSSGPNHEQDEGEMRVSLPQGSYLVEFNETIRVPLDCAGQILVRSSLWRNGATLTAGVIDAGYEGALGALLHVQNPCGILLLRNAKLGQVVVQRMEEAVEEGYAGVYQFSGSTVGRDGMSREKLTVN